MLLTLGVVVINLAATLNEVYAAWLGGLITLFKKNHFSCFTSSQEKSCLIYPTIPTVQWNTGLVIAQKYQMATSEYNIKNERSFL